MLMKWFLSALLAALAAACGTSPAPSATSNELKLSPPWIGNEHFEYNLLSDETGSPIGSGTIEVRPSSNATTIEHRYLIGKVTQHIISIVDPQRLNPISGEQQITGSQNDFSLVTSYQNNVLTIKATTAQGEKDFTISVAPDSIDNDSVLMALRAFPLADGYTTSFNTVVGASALQIKSTLTVAGKETITVPAGTFETYKVTLGFGSGSDQITWYEVAAPHRLIQYDNGQNKFVLAKSSP